MGLKQCEKCGESVDEAKAFCPACGDPFVVEEKRENSSEFDKYAGTVNVTQSVYKMMLSEFEANPQEPKVQENVISAVPDSVETSSTPNSGHESGNSSKNLAIFLAIGIGIVIIAGLGLLFVVLIYFYR